MTYASTPHPSEETKARRRRALRAARAATLCLGMATVSCSSSSPISAEDAGGTREDAGSVVRFDAGPAGRDAGPSPLDAGAPVRLDAGHDAGTPSAPDAGFVVDAGFFVDAGEPACGPVDDVCGPTCDPSNDCDCCTAIGGFCAGEGGGCAVPGPFVPPALDHALV